MGCIITQIGAYRARLGHPADGNSFFVNQLTIVFGPFVIEVEARA
jgi:hypothetical protein